MRQSRRWSVHGRAHFLPMGDVMAAVLPREPLSDVAAPAGVRGFGLRSVPTVLLLRITHAVAPVSVLEQVALDAEQAEAVARAMLLDPGVSEAVVLSTCNRMELYVAGPAPDAERALRVLAAHCTAGLEVLHRYVTCERDAQAAGHAMRVAAGLESRAVGEVEILAQLRSALGAARSAGTIGPSLSNLFRFVMSAGRQARRTGRVRDVPSLAQLALDAALPGGPKAKVTLVVGSGAMAALTVQELLRRKADYVVCARRFDRASQVARSAARVVPFEDLMSAVRAADTVICATGARSPLLRLADLERVMRERGERPLTIIDLSMPRNVDAAAGDLVGLRLLNLDDLACDVSEDVQHREVTIDANVRRYRTWLAGHAAGALIATLHERVLADCLAGLDDASQPTDVAAEAIRASAALTAHRLVHDATVRIKDHVDAGNEAAAYAVLATYGISNAA